MNTGIHKELSFTVLVPKLGTFQVRAGMRCPDVPDMNISCRGMAAMHGANFQRDAETKWVEQSSTFICSAMLDHWQSLLENV